MSGRAATDEIIAGDYAMSVGRADMPTLPGWQWVCLTDIARLETGHTPSRKHPEYWDGDIPWVGIRDANVNHGGIIEDTFQHVTELGLKNSAARLLPANTVCLSRTASVGYVVILGRPMATSQDFVCWVCSDAIIPQFLMYLLLAETDSLPRFGRGSTHTTIYFPEVKAFNICLPPLAEQRRIVGKLELLLGKVSSSQQRLSRVPGLLKRFRQSVLAAACSGKLTADWREENDEPVIDVDGDAIIDVEHLPSVPSTWTYRRAADIVAKGTVISYGMVLPGPNQPEGVPYIRGQDIDDSGNVHVDQLWKSTPQIAAKHRRSELLEGDVLLCVIRHLRVAIVPKGLDGANLTQGTVRLRPSSEILGPYLARYLASPHAQEWMKARYIGMAMPRINVEHARDVPVPLPPLSEQQEIVRRVEKLFVFADQIEARLRQAQAHVDRLTQSLLAKAFRGELVPTEHALAEREHRNYEPAAALLERLRHSRAADAPTQRSKKSKR